MNRKCFVEGCENKVGLFPYLFGLRHCEDCDKLFMKVKIFGIDISSINTKKELIEVCK